MVFRLVRWGAPALLAFTSLAHPLPAANDVAGSLSPVLVRWQAVHVVQLAVFPLVGLAAYLLLPAGASLERRVARISFSIFAISAAAFDSLVGLGTGSAVAISGHDPARAAFVQDYFAHRVVEPTFWIVYLVTGLGWLVGIGTVEVALCRSRAYAAAALLLPAAALAIDHIPPFGVVAALGLLCATAFVVVRENRVGALARGSAAR